MLPFDDKAWRKLEKEACDWKPNEKPFDGIESQSSGGRATLKLAINTKARKGRVTKELTLLDGHDGKVVTDLLR